MIVRLATVLLLILGACSSKEAPAPVPPKPRGALRGQQPPSSQQAQQLAKPDAPAGAADQGSPMDPFAAVGGQGRDPLETENKRSLPGGEAVADEPEKKRDLSAELRSAMGSPASCLKRRNVGEGPATLTISVSAHLTPSGMVSRGTASSSSLEATELACLTQRVESLRLAGPIEDAPRSVTTTITLELSR